MKEYSITHWGSHPDLDNDDCWKGEDFDSLEAAKASKLYQEGDYSTAYIVLDGPSIHQVKANPRYSARRVAREEAAERAELAIQQGMAFGCQGYNEAMGWD